MTNRLQELLINVQNPELVGEAQFELLELIKAPEVFEELFNILNSNQSESLRSSALAHILRAVEIQDAFQNPELLAPLKSHLLQFAFTHQPHKFIDCTAGLIGDIVEATGIDNWQELIPATLHAIEATETIANSIAVLSNIVKYFSVEAKTQSVEKLLEIIDAGIAYNAWPVRASSFELLSSIVDVLIDKIDITPHIAPVMEYPYDASIFQVQATKDSLDRIWVIVGELIGKDLISEELLAQIYNRLIEIGSNNRIDTYDRALILNAMLGLITKLSDEQLAQVFDLQFLLGPEIIKTGTEFLYDIIQTALTDYDLSIVYALLKARVESSFEQEDEALHAFSILVLANAVIYAPEVLIADTDFLTQTINAAFDTKSTLILESVCYFLDSLDETFTSTSNLVSEWLMKLVPLLVSESSNLRTMAYSATHCLCDILDSMCPQWFSAIWDIRESITQDDFDDYASLLAEGINRTELSDSELTLVIEYVQKFFTENSSIYESAPALIIISSILKKEMSIAGELLPPAMNVTMAALKHPNGSVKTNAIDYLGDIFPSFKSEITENYSQIIEKVREIAYSICEKGKEELEEDQNEEEEEDIGEQSLNVNRVQVAAIGTLAMITKHNKSAEYAKILQECILAGITQREEFEDYTILFTAAAEIVKLLDAFDLDQLFVNLHSQLCEDTNPRFVADAMVPYAKIIRHCGEEQKEKYIESAFEFIKLFFDGQIKCLGGISPLEGRCDYFLMTNVADVIISIVRTPSGYVDELCKVMIEIIKDFENQPAYSFLAAYSDAIEYNTCSEESINNLFEILPDIIKETRDPNMQQNICFLFNVVLQKNNDQVAAVLEYKEIMLDWFNVAREQESGYESLLSNIASMFLTIFALTNLNSDRDVFAASLEQFPPYDTTETEKMAANLVRILTRNGKNLDIETLLACDLAIARLLLLPDNELLDRKISQSTLDQIRQSFISLTNEQLWNFLVEVFGKNESKIEKLRQILGK